MFLVSRGFYSQIFQPVFSMRLLGLLFGLFVSSLAQADATATTIPIFPFFHHPKHPAFYAPAKFDFSVVIGVLSEDLNPGSYILNVNGDSAFFPNELPIDPRCEAYTLSPGYEKSALQTCSVSIPDQIAPTNYQIELEIPVGTTISASTALGIDVYTNLDFDYVGPVITPNVSISSVENSITSDLTPALLPPGAVAESVGSTVTNNSYIRLLPNVDGMTDPLSPVTGFEVNVDPAHPEVLNGYTDKPLTLKLYLSLLPSCHFEQMEYVCAFQAEDFNCTGLENVHEINVTTAYNKFELPFFLDVSVKLEEAAGFRFNCSVPNFYSTGVSISHVGNHYFVAEPVLLSDYADFAPSIRMLDFPDGNSMVEVTCLQQGDNNNCQLYNVTIVQSWNLSVLPDRIHGKQIWYELDVAFHNTSFAAWHLEENETFFFEPSHPEIQYYSWWAGFDEASQVFYVAPTFVEGLDWQDFKFTVLFNGSTIGSPLYNATLYFCIENFQYECQFFSLIERNNREMTMFFPEQPSSSSSSQDVISSSSDEEVISSSSSSDEEEEEDSSSSSSSSSEHIDDNINENIDFSMTFEVPTEKATLEFFTEVAKAFTQYLNIGEERITVVSLTNEQTENGQTTVSVVFRLYSEFSFHSNSASLQAVTTGELFNKLLDAISKKDDALFEKLPSEVTVLSPPQVVKDNTPSSASTLVPTAAAIMALVMAVAATF